MTAPELIDQLSDLGVKLWEEEGELRLKAPKGVISGEIKEKLVKSKKDIINFLKENKEEQYSNFPVVEPDRENLNRDFPLSDIQTAYYVGRDKGFELGNISCHSYYELETKDLEVDKFQNAVNKVIKTHDVLRLVFPEKGKQKILKSVEDYKVDVIDLKDLTDKEAELEHLKIREKYSHKIHEADIWPLFKIGVMDFKDKKILYFSFDLMIADFLSAFLIFRDLVKFYENHQYIKKMPEISYRDYVLAKKKARDFKPYKKSKAYWLDRLENFSTSPKLPLAKQISEVKNPVFKRRESFLEADLWENIKEKAKEYQLTPSAVLLTAYCEVLSRWSQNKDYAINLTLFNRLPVHHEILDISGDFTSVSLLEVQTGRKVSFQEKAAKIQEQLWADMDNRHFSGVNFIRELAKFRGEEGKALMPVVFSSTMGVENQSMLDFDVNKFGSLKYGITQTPQVYLDHQVLEYEGKLYYFWDSIDEIFETGLPDEMFAAYEDYLNLLGKENRIWKEVPCDQIKPESCNNLEFIEPAEDLEPVLLHQLFERNAVLYKTKEAVVSSERRLTYEELDIISENIAAELIKKGASQGDLIGISMEKGWGQAAGVLGILKAGCAYLPLDCKNPEKRMEYILNKGNVGIIISQSKLEGEIKIPDGIRKIFIEDISEEKSTIKRIKPEVNPGETAYVIFTSGSTGDPKGVVIDHMGAVNTILDINKRFEVSSGDRVLALAALNFDLSVYDIFGTLAVGGTIIMPSEEEGNDPGYWRQLIEKENVSVWNSVPQLMKMMTDHLESRDNNDLESLKLVMMSGDWIPLELPERIFRYFPNASVYSLGGATEASIWSVFYPVEEVKPHWKSIPYGWALDNQGIYILDSNLEFCPCWAVGEIHISGKGLAKGYLNDVEKTEKSFVVHPEKGERLYKTGDLGRYLPDGSIEFLGRNDFQVKVNGYRIELEEIEAAVKQSSDIKDAVVTTVESKEGKKIAAYLVSSGLNQDFMETEEIDPDKSLGFWKNIIKGANKESILVNEKNKDYETFLKFWKICERNSTNSIIETFKKMGVFLTKGEKHTPRGIVEQLQLKPNHIKLIFQWLEALKEDGTLLKDGETYQCRDSFSLLDNIVSWEETEEFADHDYSKKLLGYFKSSCENHLELFKGNINPLELFFPGGSWEIAESLYDKNPMIGKCSRVASKIVSEISETILLKGFEKLKIIEVGAGTGGTTASILPVLDKDKTEYFYTDLTEAFKEKALEKFSDYPFLEYRVYDIDKNSNEQGFEPHSFDIVVAVNVLHDSRNLPVTLSNIRKLLNPGGFLMVIENTDISRVQLTSMGFLEGLTSYDDNRENPLIPPEIWVNEFNKAGFDSSEFWPGSGEKYIDNDGIHLFLSKAPDKIKRFSNKKFKDFLKEKLPSYMIPDHVFQLEKLPLTSNGKIDRKALAKLKLKKENTKKSHSGLKTKIEKSIADIWKKLLSRDFVDKDDNFFEMGGDSLLGVRIIDMVKKEFDLEIPLRLLFRCPVLKDFAGEIEELADSQGKKLFKSEALPHVDFNKDQEYEPFPLTDIQHAYSMGRSGVYDLGDVSAHCYFELESQGLDIDHVDLAFKKLISRHGMLRTVFSDDGLSQQVLENIPDYRIKTYDLKDLSMEKAGLILDDIRKEMSHQVISTDTWPLFDIRASLMENSKTRLHLSFDNSILDAWSMFHLLKEWSDLVDNKDLALPKIDFSFRDYVAGLEKLYQTEKYNEHKKYWLGRLDSLPMAPDLPACENFNAEKKYSFSRFEKKIEKKKWEKIKALAREKDLTPSGLLLSAYSEVLGLWSKSKKFAINLTLFNRHQFNESVNDILGDFTSMTLLEVNLENGETFAERSKALQQQLFDDLDHQYFSGIEVLRALSRHKGGKNIIMPIVFTSALGLDDSDIIEDNRLGKFNYTISQTPQVLLDHQAYESGGSLVLVWDTVLEFFPEGMLGDMFDSYISIIENLADAKDFFDTKSAAFIPEKQRKSRAAFNNTNTDYIPGLLHSPFEKIAGDFKDNIAVKTDDRELSYGELNNRAEELAGLISNKVCSTNRPVAIIMEKGWEQIVSVLGVLKSGNFYLPIDPKMPGERILKILKNSGADIILTQSYAGISSDIKNGYESIDVDLMKGRVFQGYQRDGKSSAHDLAYIIYTSGSTGEPKGVMITHGAALNTVEDINKRFKINSKDKVLSISALHFDLSVYDIFGILGAGGTLVLPGEKESRNPQYWAGMIEKEKITIWNSVPQLVEMLVEGVSSLREEIISSLRLILMSGDWIPVELPEKIRRNCNCEVISLGGATEASIWSVLYPVNNVDPEWKSIPYGMPMDNQSLYILDNNMKDCPDFVPGNIYIGGTGLSLGYFSDEDKTKKSFVLNRHTGEMLYKTGDLGRFNPDGWIEFLGREDHQVKIRGYRVELGEIESNARLNKKVKNAIADAKRTSNGNKVLVLYIVGEKGEELFSEEVMEDLKTKLPDYMIPQKVYFIDSIPVTENGKVDRKNLPFDENLPISQDARDDLEPANETEKTISEIITEISGLKMFGMKESFFDMGIDSVQIVRINNGIKEKLSRNLSVTELFQYPTVSSLAEFILKPENGKRFEEKSDKKAIKRIESRKRISRRRTKR